MLRVAKACSKIRFETSWRALQPGLAGVQAHFSEWDDNLRHFLAALSKVSRWKNRIRDANIFPAELIHQIT